MKQVKVGKITIGDGVVAIQSMTNLPVTDVSATLEQIKRLAAVGCDIVRIAVPDKKSALAFAEVRKQTSMPLVADIHFDYRLALAAIDAGADKIRINPGNIASDKLDEVIAAARANNVAVRIGVNGGSLNKEIYQRCLNDKPLQETILSLDNTFDQQQVVRVAALSTSVAEYVDYFEQRNFTDLVLSVKSSNVREMIAANKLIAKLGYPLHLGVTEAGPERQGIVKNSVGIGSLLLMGIGDTIRVSLTADPVEEVLAARDLLVALGLKQGLTFVSCPKCGRCSVDLESVANEVYKRIADVQLPLKVAVMGCEVNGPGECADADLGIAGGNGRFAFFKHGQIYKYVAAENVVDEFTKELEQIVAKNS